MDTEPLFHIRVGANYVNISREEFEEWLDSVSKGKRWERKDDTAGIYIIPISDRVGIYISSSIGSRGDVLNRGNASIRMKLVSRINGYTLNKKAQGQKYFQRVESWRKNLKKGLKRLYQAYDRSASFYEALANIDDRDKYKEELVKKIESVEGWEEDDILRDFRDRVNGGGILTMKQEGLMDKRIRALKAGESPTEGSGSVGLSPEQEKFLNRLRELWKASKNAGDDWTADFAKSLGQRLKAGRGLTDRQREVLKDKLRKYGV